MVETVGTCMCQCRLQTLASAGPFPLLQVRAILDYAGGHDVKVIPCKEDMLFERMDVIIRLPEPDWASARPEGWTRGGAWGSQRTILFSGMKCASSKS